MGKPAKTSWEDRYADLLHRIMAAAVAGLDPKPLKQELDRLMTEKSKEQHEKPATPRRRAKR